MIAYEYQSIIDLLCYLIAIGLAALFAVAIIGIRFQMFLDEREKERDKSPTSTSPNGEFPPFA